MRLTLTALFIALATPALAVAGEAFELHNGDRVVLIGSTLIEREQRHGYWETLLTRRFPNVTFRNLGWSGDTVFGDAQARFGSAADGFHHRETHLKALKPSVILVGLGTNESFEGEEGLPRFLKGLDVFLDSLMPLRARVVLLAPLRQEDRGRPLPDPARQNKNLVLYRDALRTVAQRRALAFVDLYDLVEDSTRATPSAPLTDNGIHLTAYGYWRAAAAMEKGLGLAVKPWRVELQANGTVDKAEGLTLHPANGKSPLRLEVDDAILPPPPAPKESPKGACLPGHERTFRVKGLANGNYVLTVDGKPVATADAAGWNVGVKLSRGPEFEQVERLRAAIIDKNQLYFHRWRPQNETYLFGFRKHEQGKNAKEIPEFDPLIEKLEAEIATLRVPVAHTYALELQK